MATIDKMKKDGTFMTLSKKERLQVDRLRAKLEKNLGSILICQDYQLHYL
jgi:small subunit ribosomal protein S2